MGPQIYLKLYHSVKALCQAGITNKTILNQLKVEGNISSQITVLKEKEKRNQTRHLVMPQPANMCPISEDIDDDQKNRPNYPPKSGQDAL